MQKVMLCYLFLPCIGFIMSPLFSVRKRARKCVKKQHTQNQLNMLFYIVQIRFTLAYFTKIMYLCGQFLIISHNMKKYKNRATFYFMPAQNGNSAFWRQDRCSLSCLEGVTLLPFLRALFLDQAPEIYNIITCVGFRSLYFKGVRVRSYFDCLTVDFN